MQIRVRCRGFQWLQRRQVVLNGERGNFIGILRVLDLLVQVEVQAISALVTNRQIGKDEVSGLRWAVKVRNSCDRHTGQDRESRRLTGNPPVGDGPGCVQCSKQEEIGVVSKGDVSLLHVIVGVRLVDAQFHHGRRINRPSVGRRCQEAMVSSMLVVARETGDLHLAPAPQALARSGCWMTVNLYVSFFPSRVILLNEFSVSSVGGTRGGLVAAILMC